MRIPELQEWIKKYEFLVWCDFIDGTYEIVWIEMWGRDEGEIGTICEEKIHVLT